MSDISVLDRNVLLNDNRYVSNLSSPRMMLSPAVAGSYAPHYRSCSNGSSDGCGVVPGGLNPGLSAVGPVTPLASTRLVKSASPKTAFGPNGRNASNSVI